MRCNSTRATLRPFVRPCVANGLHQGIPQAISIFHFAARLKPNAACFMFYSFFWFVHLGRFPSYLLILCLLLQRHFGPFIASVRAIAERKRERKRQRIKSVISSFVDFSVHASNSLFPFNISIFMFRERKICNTNATTALIIINESLWFALLSIRVVWNELAGLIIWP